MKFIRSVLRIFFLILCSITACTSGDDTIPVEAQEPTCFDGRQNGFETGIDCGWICSNSCFEVNGLEGEVLGKVVLDNNFEYRLTGPLVVREGMELEIREGTVIKAVPGAGAYIAVAQGGRISIFGKANNPVIMTSESENPAPGDWGGLIICGKAPVNTGTPSRSATADLFYGGDDPEDSSGIIQYLRLEYTGATFNDASVFDGISFYGVGEQTTVEFVQSYSGLGNGFGFYGGTVRANGLVSTSSTLAGYNLTDGWNGSLTNLYGTTIGTSGIFMRNGSINGQPVTTGQISNCSFIGPSMQSALFYGDSEVNMTLSNVYTSTLNLGIEISEEGSNGVDEGKLIIEAIQFDNPNPGFQPTNYNGSNPGFYTVADTLGAGNGPNLPDWAQFWTTGL